MLLPDQKNTLAFLNNEKIDNVTVERVKPCFSQSDALPRPAKEEHTEVNIPAPLAAPAPPAPAASPIPPAPPAPAAQPEPYRTCYGRISRKPDTSCSTPQGTMSTSFKHLQRRGVMWHMPHGISLHTTLKNSNSYYLPCDSSISSQ